MIKKLVQSFGKLFSNLATLSICIVGFILLCCLWELASYVVVPAILIGGPVSALFKMIKDLNNGKPLDTAQYPWARIAIVVLLSSFALGLAWFLKDYFSKSSSPLYEFAPKTFVEIWLISAFIAVVWMGSKMLNGFPKFIEFSITGFMTTGFFLFPIFFVWLLLAIVLPIANPLDIQGRIWQYYGVSELITGTSDKNNYSDFENDFIIIPGRVYDRNSENLRELRKQRKERNCNPNFGLIGFMSWKTALVAGFLPAKGNPKYSEPITTQDKIVLFLTIGPSVLLNIFWGSLFFVPGHILILWVELKKGNDRIVKSLN